MELHIEVSKETVAQIESRVAQSKFESTEKYIEFVLREVAAPRPELESNDREISDREEEVQEQLRSLGYLE